MSAKILAFPNRQPRRFELTDRCRCGEVLGDHGNTGLECPVRVGDVLIGYLAYDSFQPEEK